MSTYFPSGKDLAGRRKWYVVDASGRTVGHLASEVASLLTGKRNPEWTPFMDLGDHVIVINARKAVLKGNKVEQKLYRHHTLYLGGLKSESVEERRKKHPTRIVEEAMDTAGLPRGCAEVPGPRTHPAARPRKEAEAPERIPTYAGPAAADVIEPGGPHDQDS